MAVHTLSLTTHGISLHKGLHTRSKTKSVHHQTCLSGNVTGTAALMELPILDVNKVFKQGSGLKEAVDILQTDFQSYGVILQECARSKDLRQGKRFHALISHTGFERDTFIGNNLISMYMKCGSLVDARLVFDKMPERNVISWNAMMAGYSSSGQCGKVVRLFCEMQKEQVKPNRSTFVSLLKACVSTSDVEQVHALVIRTGFSLDVNVASILVDVYIKCGGLFHARQVFDEMPERDVVSWTSMITGYTQNEHGDEALDIFYEMCLRGVRPNHFTFASALTACGGQGAIEEGLTVHANCIKTGVSSDAFVSSALITMYMKCGNIEQACKVFGKKLEQNMVSWTAMIAGYMQNGYSEEALSLFHQMQGMGLRCNQFTFASVLSACADLIAIEEGRQVHTHVIKTGFEHAICVANALLTMYAKGKCTDDAIKVFTKLHELDSFLWSAMISAYAQNEQCESALQLFREMQRETIMLDESTFASVLAACANLAVAIGRGKQVHANIIKTGFDSSLCVRSALVTMYAKCGSIEEAKQVFDNTPALDVVLWNTMISGYAQHGHGKRALELFEQMKQVGLKPDYMTFVGVLSACSHVGLVDEGYSYFNSMISCYQIIPIMEHYNCMVDIIGRAGRLDEAMDFINKMPFEADAMIWRTLLGACSVHGNLELGEAAAEHIFELEPEDSATYILLSNIYSAAGRWKDSGKMRKMMHYRKIKKEAGCSWIEIRNRVHAFVASDKSHPQTAEIYSKLGQLNAQMKQLGFVPDTNFVHHNMAEEQKEYLLLYHSEKLALSYGLISSTPGTCIQIFKNLRVCGDCHTAIKFISKIVQREIVVRDTNRFHHFKDGLCSCGDYW